ncbi:MAG: hypothetical protein CM15mV142_450 [Caudoviricetes sp.]|nr:MAG: hypothetical protein CM15mV142_450 [Caudoviricetes sp.]
MQQPANNLIVGTGSGDEGITILSGQSVGHHGSIFFADGTGATNSKRGQIRYEQNNERMKFFTAGTQKLTIDINGNVGSMGPGHSFLWGHKITCFPSFYHKIFSLGPTYWFFTLSFERGQ